MGEKRRQEKFRVLVSGGELWFVTEQTWTLDEWGFCLDPQTEGITEFRGNGRQRYMVRERDPAWADTVLPGTTRWSDYDGDEIYGDYVVDDETGAVTNTMAYLPGVAQMDILSGEITYFHSDLISSLRAVSDQQSAVNGVMVYTAFGEKVYSDGTVGTRYQYAGAWGYESSVRPDALADLGWQHVGHRYYDTSTGRFLQRDPIGMLGGPNVYAYVLNLPTIGIDLSGTIPIWVHKGFLGLTGDWVWPAGARWRDRLGDRIGGRNPPAGPAGAGGLVGAGRVPKGVRIPGQTGTTCIWRRMLIRAGHGTAGRTVAWVGGYLVLLPATVYEVYIIGEEAIYTWYEIPPGVY